MRKKFSFVRSELRSTGTVARVERRRRALGSPRLASSALESPHGVSGDTSGPEQLGHPHEIVCRGGEDKRPGHARGAVIARLPLQADGLEPPEDLFHPLARLLADRISGMTRGPPVEGAAAGPVDVLGDVRRDPERPHGGHTSRGVVAFVRPQRPAARRRGSRRSNCGAVVRSAVPCAGVTVAPTASPCRFSISTWP